MTVIFKRLFGIDGVGFKKGSVPTDFIFEILERSWRRAYIEHDMDLTYYSTMTSNSHKDMETWTFTEFKRRSQIMKRAIENKSSF